MALLERVSTLLRANLNDLLDKAEDPEKLSKQILLDMESQLLQVKTQVAVAIVDQHRVMNQQRVHEEEQSDWHRKAELAVGKGQDDLARAALERSLSHGRLAKGFAQQHAEQIAEAETLHSAYLKLQGKLTETKVRIELLLAQHRRNRLVKGSPVQPLIAAGQTSADLSRLVSTVAAGKNVAQTNRTMQAMVINDTVEDRFQSLEQADQIEALLSELKKTHLRLKS